MLSLLACSFMKLPQALNVRPSNATASAACCAGPHTLLYGTHTFAYGPQHKSSCCLHIAKLHLHAGNMQAAAGKKGAARKAPPAKQPKQPAKKPGGKGPPKRKPAAEAAATKRQPAAAVKPATAGQLPVHKEAVITSDCSPCQEHLIKRALDLHTDAALAFAEPQPMGQHDRLLIWGCSDILAV